MRQTAPAVEFIHKPRSHTKGMTEDESSQAGSSSQYTSAYWSNLVSYLSHFHGGLTVEDERSGDGAAQRESPCVSAWKLWMKGRENILILWMLCHTDSHSVIEKITRWGKIVRALGLHVYPLWLDARAKVFITLIQMGWSVAEAEERGEMKANSWGQHTAFLHIALIHQSILYAVPAYPVQGHEICSAFQHILGFRGS